MLNENDNLHMLFSLGGHIALIVLRILMGLGKFPLKSHKKNVH